jgi:carbamoyl-phosphate synthase large subunit
MNILITSAGRRSQIVKYFQKELCEIGLVVAADSNPYSSAIYEADKHYIVPKVDSEFYIDTLIDICGKEKICAIFSLIDPELSILARNIKRFEKIGVKLLSSSSEVCRLCFDKFEMFEFCRKNNILYPKTYLSISDFKNAYLKKEIEFPVLTKPRFGSGSICMNIAHSLNALEIFFNQGVEVIIQELLVGQEYGVDGYIDFMSGEIVSVFVKEKLEMRAGETDKAVSVLDRDLMEKCSYIIKAIGLTGQIDMDFFKANNSFYLLDINPRFGGGYPLAYECGCNFPGYILRNLTGKSNPPVIGEYLPGIYMFKKDAYIIHKS